MLKFKNLLVTIIAVSAIIFTGCQNEPNPVEPENATQQGLSKFSIPDGATFVSATFNIHLWSWVGNGVQEKDVNVHRITNLWEEMVVTWNNFGESYAPEVEGSFHIAALGYYSVDVTALVGNWLDGTHPNYGLLLDHVPNNPRGRFNSRENNFNNPYLEICYNLNGVTICEQIEPIGDSTVREAAPDENLGADGTLYCGTWSSPTLDKQPILMFDIEQTPQEDCEECDGKVTELTLQYNGANPAQVMVKQKNGDVVFPSQLLQPGDVFNIVGTDNGTFGNEIKIYVDGNENAKIHTSCSKPIGPGLVKGYFEVISGSSKNGGELCPIPPPPPPGFCEGKVKALLVQYTGEGCILNHNQDLSKVQCAGDAAFTTPVRIIASDKENLNDSKVKIWFDKNDVTLNSTFWIDATNAGKTKLGSKTFVHIYDLQGNLLQFIEFHTSCSQPLDEGDQFGSILMIDFIPE